MLAETYAVKLQSRGVLLHPSTLSIARSAQARNNRNASGGMQPIATTAPHDFVPVTPAACGLLHRWMEVDECDALRMWKPGIQRRKGMCLRMR